MREGYDGRLMVEILTRSAFPDLGCMMAIRSSFEDIMNERERIICGRKRKKAAFDIAGFRY